MKKFLASLFTPLTIILYTGSILLIATVSYAENYTVERIVDGDTIVVTTPEGKSEKVCLIGIDAPESKNNKKAKRDSERTGQDIEAINKMGQEATDYMEMVVSGKEVRLEFDVQDRDKYGRLLAYVFLDDPYTKFRESLPYTYWLDESIFVNATMVKAGYATPMTIPPNVKYADLFKELYEEAREEKRGLWKNAKENNEATRSKGVTPPSIVFTAPGYFFGKASAGSSA